MESFTDYLIIDSIDQFPKVKKLKYWMTKQIEFFFFFYSFHHYLNIGIQYIKYILLSLFHFEDKQYGYISNIYMCILEI